VTFNYVQYALAKLRRSSTGDSINSNIAVNLIEQSRSGTDPVVGKGRSTRKAKLKVAGGT